MGAAFPTHMAKVKTILSQNLYILHQREIKIDFPGFSDYNVLDKLIEAELHFNSLSLSFFDAQACLFCLFSNSA